MVVRRDTGSITHHVFHEIAGLLNADDCLVLNKTRVIPARFSARRSTGGLVRGLFIEERGPGVWDVLLTGAGRVKDGETLSIAEGPWRMSLVEHGARGRCTVRLDPPDPAEVILARVGKAPLPPYIRREQSDVEQETSGPRREGPGDPTEPGVHPTSDVAQQDSSGRDATESHPSQCSASQRHSSQPHPSRPSTSQRPASRPNTSQRDAAQRDQDDLTEYQTVYAAVPGAIAAPTAGIHFTPDLLEAIRMRGTTLADLVLHVGIGTFAPIETDDLASHPMHAERYSLDVENAALIQRARSGSGRVVAVGTTSVRVLETLAGSARPDGRCSALRDGAGETDLLIYPPYVFKAVDALLTNFHLPGSTLLALVFALAGRDLTLRAYDQAVREAYRFYSYGDAMLIL